MYHLCIYTLKGTSPYPTNDQKGKPENHRLQTHTDWGKICNRSQGGYTRKYCHASGLSQMQPGSGWGPTFLFSQLHQSFFARGGFFKHPLDLLGGSSQLVTSLQLWLVVVPFQDRVVL